MAIAKVQSFSVASGSAVTSLATSAFTALTTGNLVVVACGCTQAVGISINSGTVEWTAVITSSTAVPILTVYLGRIISGGGTIITVNSGQATQATTITGIEFSGFTRPRIDRTAQNLGTTSPATSGALPTTASANQLWLAAVAARNDTFSSQTINTVNADFDINIATTYAATTANRSVDLFYRIVSGTGTPNCNDTLGATTVWKCSLIAIEETPAGAAATTGYTFCG